MPVAVLALLAFAGGLFVQPFEDLAASAASVIWNQPVSSSLAYHLDLRPTNAMALLVWGLGALLVLSLPLWRGWAAFFDRVGQRLGPERWYRAGLLGLNWFSDRMFSTELRSLANRLISILVPAALLLWVALVITPSDDLLRATPIEQDDILLVMLLLLLGLAGVVVALPRRHTIQVMALSAVSYALTALYAHLGAPNLALVSVLVSAATTVFFFGIFMLFPKEVLESQAEERTPASTLRLQIIVGVMAGLSAFIVAWAALTDPAAREGVASEYIRLTPDVHASDVVTAILADFRGFDTMGEITVVAIALIGIAIMLRWRDYD